MIRFVSAALVLILSTHSSLAEEASVSRTYACLDKPFSGNRQLVQCLADVEAEAERRFESAGSLTALAKDLNSRSQILTNRVEAVLSKRKGKRFDQRLQKGGWSFYQKCLTYQMKQGVNQELVLARCNFDAELWTLHFVFDNYRKAWEATKGS